MRERRSLILALLFVVAMAGLYALALRAPPAPEAPPTPAAATPAAPKRPPTKTRAPRAAPAPATVEASPQEDRAEEAPSRALVLKGTVRDSGGAVIPNARVMVERDGQPRPFAARPTGEFLINLPLGDVVIWAERRDGLLQTASPRIDVRGGQGGEQVIDLIVPAEVRGGVGVGVAESDTGMLVRVVHPGSPAAAAGIESGDHIVALDGRSVVGWTVSDFVAQMTGPEGTTVRFTLQTREGDDQDLELIRRRIDGQAAK